MRGREKFEKHERIILLVSKAFNLLPSNFNKKLLEHYRRKNGYIGLAFRYALLRNIAKKVGKNVAIYPDVYLLNTSDLEIGDNVSIHPMTYIDASGGVAIGNDVSIAHGATIMSTTHIYNDIDIPIKNQGTHGKRTVIENDVWLGAKSVILCGIHVGTGAIIGAGAVVTKNVDDYTIVAGSPAKSIKRRG